MAECSDRSPRSRSPPIMYLSQFALDILESSDVETKLRSPSGALEDRGVEVAVPSWPSRSPDLEIVSARQAPVPKLRGWPDIEQRRRILHALANHELQAVELYARALLQFAEGPAALRHDLLRVAIEEQRHTRSYLRRLETIGGRFGDYPVSGYFWRKISLMDTPLRFVCAMSLTFENANLDHSLESEAVARQSGDEATARLLAQIHCDEIEHVRFGWKWLARLKPPRQTMWFAYREALLPPLHAGRASGRDFHAEPRRMAGFDSEFIDGLRRANRDRRRRAPRGT